MISNLRRGETAALANPLRGLEPSQSLADSRIFTGGLERQRESAIIEQKTDLELTGSVVESALMDVPRQH